MDRSLPSTWRPSSEAELEAALREGLFNETPMREAKQQLRSAKDQAKDMASFGIDGGLILVGVKEDKDTGDFGLSPIEWRDQILESPARIAAASCDPPLQVSVHWIESERHPGSGYLLIEIPASPLAPHMVGGVYYGRGDKEKQRLTDADVERIIRTRDASLDQLRRALASFVENDPFPEGKLAHLHLLAVPTGHREGMFRSLAAEDNPQPLLFNLVRDGISRETQKRGRGASEVAPNFDSLHAGFRTSGGVGIKSQPDQDSQEDYDLRFVVREQGEVSLYCARASAWNNGSHQLFDDGLVFKVRAFLDLLCRLAEENGYGGSWDVGMSLNRMRGVRAWEADRFFGPEIPFDADEYKKVIRVTRADLESPGAATGRLVGELLRSLGLTSSHKHMLTDPEVPSGGPV